MDNSVRCCYFFNSSNSCNPNSVFWYSLPLIFSSFKQTTIFFSFKSCNAFDICVILIPVASTISFGFLYSVPIHVIQFNRAGETLIYPIKDQKFGSDSFSLISICYILY